MKYDEIIHHDEFGKAYVLDEAGNHRPPMQIKPTPGTADSNGCWPDYDTSQGHCGLCGRLTCNGTCFK